MIDSILAADQKLFLALNGDGGPVMDAVMWAFSSKFVWIPLYITVFYFVWRRVGWRRFVIFVVAAALFVLCADQFCNFFKLYMPKLRPTHNEAIAAMVHTVNGYRGGLYGTVSSHAALSFGFAMMTSLVLRRRWYSWAIFGWAAVVAYSRIYLGVHYPLDLIFGTMAGLAFGWLFYRAYRSKWAFRAIFRAKGSE